MLINKVAYKYENQYKLQYKMIQCWTNGIVKLQMGATTNILEIQSIKPYNVED